MKYRCVFVLFVTVSVLSAPVAASLATSARQPRSLRMAPRHACSLDFDILVSSFLRCLFILFVTAPSARYPRFLRCVHATLATKSTRSAPATIVAFAARRVSLRSFFVLFIAYLFIGYPCWADECLGRPKIGLALGGGGTRGAAHVGVLRVLEQEGIPIDLIAGTSMGSVVGGLYSAGLSVDAIEEKFTKGSLMKSFMTVPLSLRIAAIPLFYLPRIFGYRPYEGLYRGGKFRNYLNASVPECTQQIENLKIPFGAVALNLLDGRAYAIRKGNLGQALQASSAIPVLRRPVKLEDKLFVDGGVIANLPVNETKAMGADIVIASNVDEFFEVVQPATFQRIGTVAHRIMTLHLAQIDGPQLQKADIAIHPNLNGISLISTRTRDAKLAIEAGEKAAREVVPQIKALLRQRGITSFSERTNTSVSNN